MPLYFAPQFGGLAQLGERDNGIVEASGSIPLSSTLFSASGKMKRVRPLGGSDFFLHLLRVQFLVGEETGLDPNEATSSYHVNRRRLLIKAPAEPAEMFGNNQP